MGHPTRPALKFLRSCTNTLYKAETGGRRDNLKSAINWRLVRWALLPSLALILLALTVYCIAVSQSSEPELVDGGGDVSSVASLLDLEAHHTYARPPGSLEEYKKWNGSWRSSQSGLEEELTVDDETNGLDEENPGNDTDLVYSDGEDMTFIDRLISSFKSFSRSDDQLAILPNVRHGDSGSAVDYSTTPLPVSPTLPSLPVRSSSPAQDHQSANATTDACFSPRLRLCRGVVPWDLTTLPGGGPGLGSGGSTALDQALPYYELVVQSGCSARAAQFLCSLLEPQCQPPNTPVLPPCRTPCRVVAEECNDFVLDLLDLSQVFNCENYPDSNNPTECVNLARGENCLKNEMRCGDGSCIPQRWRCNGIKDCPDGKDEENCTYCGSDHFTCEIGGKCIPRLWRCDGRPDCPDHSDEIGCHRTEYERISHSHTSPCPSGELRCVDGRCITLQQICDGSTDCSDGADEANCRLTS